MQSASAAVPTPKPMLFLLEDAVKALLWTMPRADFSIYVDPQGAGATVTDAEGKDHFGDVRHPQPMAMAVREAMIPAFNAQPASGWARVERVEPGELERAFCQAWTWLPNHILRVGRDGDHVWAEAEPTTDDWGSTVLKLNAAHFDLAEVLMAVASLRLFDINHGKRPLTFSAPEVREAA